MDLSSLDPNSIKLGFIVGFGTGFIFTVYILDHMYKKCLKQATDEMIKQYQDAIRNKK